MAIKFLRDHKTKELPPRSFKEGQEVKDFSDASELHFVTRGVAAYVGEKGVLTDHQGRELPLGGGTAVVVNTSDNRDGEVGRAGETALQDGTPQRASSGPGEVVTGTAVTEGESKPARRRKNK